MILGLAYSPDAQTVASCGGEPIVRLWSLKTGKAEGTLEGSPANVRSVAFTPDGKQVAYVVNRNGGSGVWLAKLETHDGDLELKAPKEVFDPRQKRVPLND